MKKQNFTWRKGMKLVSLLTAATLSLGVLAGCGSTANDKDDQGRTIISVGAWPSKEGKDLDNANDRKARFEAANPEYVIEGDQWVLDLKSFYAKAAGGQLPIVYQANFTEMSQIMDAGYSADLTEELKENGVLDKLNKDVLDIISKDGKVYAYPKSCYVLGLACNITDFEKAGLMNEDGTPKQPKTWDEVTEYAVKLKEATGKPGFALTTMNNAGGWRFTNIAWSFGANFMEKGEDGKWKAIFNSPECAAALQWVKDLKWKYDVLPTNALIDNTEYFKLFATNNASMIMCDAAVASQVPQYDMDINTVGMMAMPAGPKKHVTLMGGYLFPVSNKATKDQIKGAAKWIQMESSPNLQGDRATDMEKDVQRSAEKGNIVGIKAMSIWNDDAEALKYSHELIDKYTNVDPNHLKLYNDFVADVGDCEIRPEEPVCCQELYATLDSCIQEVLTNKDSDPVAVLEKANADFQQNYLDNVDY